MQGNSATMLTYLWTEQTALLYYDCWRHYPVSDFHAKYDWLEWLESMPKMSGQESIEVLRNHTKFRNTHYIGMVGLRMMAQLQRPISDVIPDRPRLRVFDEGFRESAAGRNLQQYMGVAIELGDAAAINAITRWMKQFVKRGADEYDWPTILKMWRYTAEALEELADEWTAGLDVSALTNQDLLHRIQRAGLKVQDVLEAPKNKMLSHAGIIVAKEYNTTRAMLKKQWKRRHTHLPAGHRLLA